jgi:hypothetical protein
MEKKNIQEPRKRVSFATEARVKYIYNNGEPHDMKGNLSYVNMSIDMDDDENMQLTTDCAPIVK